MRIPPTASETRCVRLPHPGAVLLLGSSLTVVGAAMIAPVLPKLGAEFGPVDPQANLLVPL